MKKNFYKVILCVAVFCLTVINLWAQTEVRTADDLNNVRNGLSGSYILMNDIDMSGVTNWQPIGMTGANNTIADFTGTFDGQGYAIKNLNYTYAGTGTNMTGGLFGRIGSPGLVRNLELRNFRIEGTGPQSSVGALTAVIAPGGSAEQIAVIGCTLIGTNEVAGITARTGAAGIQTIKNCYVDPTTTITGTQNVGGLVGYMTAVSSLVITNCYVAAAMKCTGNTAYGLIGGFNNTTARPGTVITSTFVMARAMEGTTLQPFFNTANSIGATSNYFACSDYFPSLASDNAKTLSELQQEATYIGWEFGKIWAWEGIDVPDRNIFPVFYKEASVNPVDDEEIVAAAKALIEGATFTVDPTIANNEDGVTAWLVTEINNLITATTGITVSESDIALDNNTFTAASIGNAGSFDFTVSLSKGSATDDASNSGIITAMIDPDGTPVSTFAELDAIRNNLSGKYYLKNDIDMSEVNNWQPIGMTGTTNTVADFSGTFDGKGYAIKNLNYTFDGGTTTNMTGGLFGRIGGSSGTGTVKNLTLQNFIITGAGNQSSVGALAAVIGQGGSAEQIAVIGCTLSGTNEVGGIAGRSGANNPALPQTIKNCYIDPATTITGTQNVGGFVGNMSAISSLVITNCYVAAIIGCTGNTAYGVIGGFNNSNARTGTVITNTFVMARAAAETTLQPFVPTGTQIGASTYYVCSEYFPLETETDNVIALADLQIQDTYSLVGWDFTNIWKIEEGKFPIFQWEEYPKPDVDAEAVATAKTAIENDSYSVNQSIANTETDVKVWLATQINNLIASTDITVSESDISLSNFIAASNNIDGSFDFTVSLSKGNANGSAGTSGTITADLTGMCNVKAGQSWVVTGANNRIEVTAFKPLFLSVCNIAGKTLFSDLVDNQISIPVNKGIYILKLRNTEKETVQKIIVK